MRQRGWIMSGGMVGLLFSGVAALAAPTTEFELATTLNGLSRQIANNDLINGNAGSNEGFDNFGEVDDHQACLIAATDPCLSVPGICQPSEGFDPCCGATLPNLTDGAAGMVLNAVLRDYARAALIVRYNLPAPTNIGSIVVYAANEDPNAPGNGRIFQTYSVEISTNNGGSFTQLGPLVTTGTFGANNAANNRASFTRLFDNNSQTLASGVTNLRFIFYCVSNTQGFYLDPWQGVTSEDGIYQSECPDAEAEDTDGRRKAFEAPIIKEIDVFPPSAEPPPCNDPVFDVAGGGPNGDQPDGAVDQQDFGVFQSCFTGAGDPGGVFASLPQHCKCMDLTGNAGVPDGAISQDDFGRFENCATGPAPLNPVNPNCDN
jgi:hypothetical protein